MWICVKIFQIPLPYKSCICKAEEHCDSFLLACPPWLHFANSLLHVWNKAGSAQRRPLMPPSRTTAKSRSELRLQSRTRICRSKRRLNWTSGIQRYGEAFVSHETIAQSLMIFKLYGKTAAAGNFLYKKHRRVIDFTPPVEIAIIIFFFLPFVTSFASLGTPTPHSKDGNQSYSFAGDKGWFPQWKDLFCWCFHSSSCWLGLRCPTGDHVQNQMFNQPSVLKRYRLFVNV